MRNLILTIALVFFASQVESQSVIQIKDGASLEVGQNADICADMPIVILGILSGDGTVCGEFLSPAGFISIQVFLEGYLDPITGNMNSRPLIHVLLRDKNPPYALIDSTSNYVDSTSGKALFSFNHRTPGNFYIVVKHMNSLETWSAQSVSYIPGEKNTVVYNFASDSSLAYGNNMVKKSGYWCIYSGDVNQDGIIDAIDRAMPWNVRNTIGFIPEDVNGDGIVDAQDRGIVWNNRNKAVMSPLDSTPIEIQEIENNY